ncbi:uncharacterized protein EI90DRAFT_3126207 [Cantharellus anzutake]|uniref:uncharacterized protein n=1 Tax=Cantharellus anzutake TaxID=1750568 RepID=UPI00190489B6|nr:uncharacterized protein EI90DRAFT_3126207 [Cantharellus anzutake]KAF8328423.1 hypothetical protein EI90DRAFT_3126207 [Cantharellus anzutake]
MNARGVPYARFLDATFPIWKNLPTRQFNKLRKPLRQLRDRYLEVAEDLGSKEEDLYEPFADLMHKILHNNAGLCEYVKSHKKRKLQGAVKEAARGPDGVIIYKPPGQNEPTNADDLHWREILLVIDLKRTKNFGATLNPPKSNSGMTEEQIEIELKKNGSVKLDGRQQLASYGLEQLSSNPLKQFSHGMAVIDSFVESWYYDRSGPIGSSVIDLRRDDDFELFCKQVLATSYADPLSFGFNPRFDIKRPVSANSQKITIGGWDISFDASRPIHVSRGFTGRCSTIFCASTQTPDTGVEHQCVLKLSYQPCDRIPSEADHYALLWEKEVKGIPEILCWEKFPSLAEEGPRCALMEYLPDYQFGAARYLEAIVIAERFEPITSIDINKDTKSIFKVFLSIIETHHQAYEVAGILHRDIHVDNLMWTIVDGQPTGFLIDWDFASGPATHPPEDHQQTAFTLNAASLAIDLLQNEPLPRLYRHDLESFFWALWSIILTGADAVGLDEFVKVSRWEQGSVEERKAWKQAFLDRGYRGAIARLNESEKTGLSLPNITACLVQLCQLIFDGQEAIEYRSELTNVETADDHITYAKFVAAVKLAIQ